jgi:putative transposase
MVEGIVYRCRCGIAWREVPEVFGAWQTIWTWHRRMAGVGAWDTVLARLLAAADASDVADAVGLVDWSVSVDSTIARAHQHATNITRSAGGWVELHESAGRAA